MNEPSPIKWALIMKSILLLSLSLVLIIGGLSSIVDEFKRPYRAEPIFGLVSMIAGLAVALLVALSFITIENQQLMKGLQWAYKALRLAFKAFLLLFGGWLVLLGGSCVDNCGKYWESNWYLFVGAIIVGIGTIAHALPFVPALLRTILGLLMGMVLLWGGGGFFLLMLWDAGQDSINIDRLPALLPYILLPLGVAWVEIRFLLGGYKFISGRKSPT